MKQNKHFNSYKEGLDLEVLRRYCEEHGEERMFERGETLEDVGEPAQWVAFVERGCFKYMVHRSATKETLGSSKNDEEGRSATKETLATKGTQEPVQDGLWARPRPLPLHRPQPLPSAHRPLSSGGADALAEGHRLVPQHHAHLPEQTPQGNDVRNESRGQARLHYAS